MSLNGTFETCRVAGEKTVNPFVRAAGQHLLAA
jgi:hypothetical protein